MYSPQVDDYVIWKRPNGDIEEGWVYFKGDVMPKKKGWNESPRYITIEIGVYPKPDYVYSSGKLMRHRNNHILLLCYEHCWNELEYVKNRRDTPSDERPATPESMYKSQEGRYSDVQ